jgi:hypothetical protein
MRNGTRARCEVRNCQVCGQEYVTYPSHKSWSCSRPCARKNALRDPNIIPPSRKKVIGWHGEQSPHWQGGRTIRRGYVHVWNPDHPSIAGRGTKRKYVLEHRLVMEQTLGRLLKPTERVHHRNGIKTDNRPENLELWETGHPSGQRVGEREPMIELPLSLFLALVQRFALTVS